jgi:hypothetical protein
MLNKPREDDPEQSKRFLEPAKEADADEIEKGAQRAFKAVAKPRKPKVRRQAAKGLLIPSHENDCRVP